MAKSVLEIVMETIKQGQGGKQAAAELRELKGTVGEVSQGLLGFNLGTLSAAGAIVAAAGAANQAITEYQAYGESIRNLEAITGTGTEQTSRLVQAFDDLGVSQEKVTSAMETAAKKGFVATIDNVANLADRYVALGTQQEKNALLNKELGKGGLDLAIAFQKGGDAIRDAAKAQSDGLIITQKNLLELERLRKTQDDLGDSLKALEFTFAKTFVPILETYTGVLAHSSQYVKDFKEETGLLFPVLSPLIGLYAIGRERLDSFNQSQEQATLGMANATTAALGMANAFVGLDKVKEQAKAIDSVAEAIKNLDEARNNFGQSVAGQIKSGLEASGLSGDALNQALLVVDQQLGTNTFNEQQLQNWIANIVNRYSTGSGLGEFQNSLGQLQNTMMPLDRGVQGAQQNLMEKTSAIINMNFNINNNMDWEAIMARIRYELPGWLEGHG